MFVVLIASACSTTEAPHSVEAPQTLSDGLPQPVAVTPPPAEGVPPDQASEKPAQAKPQEETQEIPGQAVAEESHDPVKPLPSSQNNVYFSPASAQVEESGKAVLQRHAARLKRNPRLVVTLIGHADPLGSRSYNVAIAEERMDSVFQILRSLGVPKGQIRRLNSGHRTTGNNCKSADCRRRMRRVELAYPK